MCALQSLHSLILQKNASTIYLTIAGTTNGHDKRSEGKECRLERLNSLSHLFLSIGKAALRSFDPQDLQALPDCANTGNDDVTTYPEPSWKSHLFIYISENL